MNSNSNPQPTLEKDKTDSTLSSDTTTQPTKPHSHEASDKSEHECCGGSGGCGGHCHCQHHEQ